MLVILQGMSERYFEQIFSQDQLTTQALNRFFMHMYEGKLFFLKYRHCLD